jgi:hypothetical protein
MEKQNVISASCNFIDEGREQAQHLFIEPLLGLKICKGGEHDAT